MVKRFIYYRETTYIEDANNQNLRYDLYRQKRKLERALEIEKDHQVYYYKLALLTRYEMELKELEVTSVCNETSPARN